ncbi:MAG: carboxymuconolactone decarboxylase family protein [Fimbriimonadaceae bacterium]|nr:carboxymuconolactone decarboxylase family protein [Fimbriimonadaceae bacterium]
MAYLDLVDESRAEGFLARLYERARARAGKVYRIVVAGSLGPKQLNASLGLYGEIMHGDSPLTRTQREMIAVVVSTVNHCHY